MCDERRPGPQARSRLSGLDVQQEAQVAVVAAGTHRAGGAPGTIPSPKSALTRVIFGRGSRSTLPHGRLQPVLQARSRGCGGVAGLAHRSVL